MLFRSARYGSKSELVPLDGDDPLLAIALKVLTRRLLRQGARYGERKYPYSETKYKNLKHGG